MKRSSGAPILAILTVAGLSFAIPEVAQAQAGAEAKPDLVVLDLEMTDGFRWSDQQLEFTWRVGNTGANHADSFWCSAYLDDVLVYQGRCEAGRPRLTQLGPFAPGPHVFRAVVDDPSLLSQEEYEPFGEVQESNESNNSDLIEFTVADDFRPADLVIWRLRTVPAILSAGEGEDFIIEFTPRNLGGREAGEFQCSLSLDGEQLDTKPCREGRMVQWPVGMANPGDHVVTAIVDVTELVDELTEENNRATKRFTIR